MTVPQTTTARLRLGNSFPPPIVNFINIYCKHTFFVQKFFLYLEFGFERTFVQKINAYNVDEIDTWSQSHQHFTSSLCNNIFSPKS